MASYLDEGLWRRTKTTSSKGKMKLRLHWLSAEPAQEDGPAGLCLCPSTKGCHVSRNQQPFPTPGSLCVQSASSNSISVGFKRIFCLHICTPSPFFKDGFKPRCLQERGRNESIHRGIQKIQFGENAIIFDEMGEGQEASSVNYCRYNFLIKSGKKAACSFCFYCINS